MYYAARQITLSHNMTNVENVCTFKEPNKIHGDSWK